MEALKTSVKNYIEQILAFDLSKTYKSGANKQPWNGFPDADLEHYVKNIHSILVKINKDDSLLNNIGFANLTTLQSHLQNLINTWNSSGLQSLELEAITTQHHGVLVWIENLNNLLRSVGLYAEVKINTGAVKKANESFATIQPFLDGIIRDEPRYKAALESLQSLLTKQGEVNSAALSGQADAFKKRAEEYQTTKRNNSGLFYGGVKFWRWGLWHISGSWGWLFLAFIFAGVTGYITYVFFHLSVSAESNITAGTAILRIASLLVPSYLTVFSITQFLYSKKMYEAYMFKYATLQTMNNLITTNNDLKENILSRGLEVLFSEPNVKGSSDSKEDKILIGQLLDMLRNQLK